MLSSNSDIRAVNDTMKKGPKAWLVSMDTVSLALPIMSL